MDMDAITEITPQHPHWPAGLRDLNERMPQRLWVRGATAVLALPGVALVGSRASTAQGNVNARQIADRSGDAGFAVISGLAYGIDAAAHSTAVSRQMPTVAYLATGVDRIYPAGHQDLAQAIVDSGGALVSAYPPGSAALLNVAPGGTVPSLVATLPLTGVSTVVTAWSFTAASTLMLTVAVLQCVWFGLGGQTW